MLDESARARTGGGVHASIPSRQYVFASHSPLFVWPIGSDLVRWPAGPFCLMGPMGPIGPMCTARGLRGAELAPAEKVVGSGVEFRVHGAQNERFDR
jgi:hypothetical protein